MPGKHALLSPSAASRWLACTPSARLETEFPDKGESTDGSFTAAYEGTLAHKFGELFIKRKAGLVSKAGFNKELKVLQADPFFAAQKNPSAEINSMSDHCEDYAVYVMENFADAITRTKDAKLFIETKLDMTAYVPEGFGTADVIIVADHTLDFIDLKYGKGVEVSAIENKQLMLYALGVVEAYGMLYDIQVVRMHIYQPRLQNISVFGMDAQELIAWGINELMPKAMLAFAGKGEFVPGKHCQFCRARPTCKAHADKQLEIFDYHLKAPKLLNDDEVADIIHRAKELTSWLGEITDYALEQAVNSGKKWPGYKLVEGRSNRMYTDQDAVADRLINAGFTEDKIYKPKELLGITEMEKTLTKKVFNLELSDLVKKPAGKPTLAPITDNRPEFNSTDRATADFAEEIYE